MDDLRTALGGTSHRGGVADVGLDHLDPVEHAFETTGIAAPVVVEHADLAAEPGQAVDQGRAEETGAAGDEGGHEAVASPSPWLPRQT